MSESNNNFQDLKRLLKLKQHEVPPPGYFNQFSGDVISRLRAGEVSEETLADRLGSGSLWTYLLQIFQAKPGVVGGLATSLCLLLLVGVVLVDHEPGTPGGMMAGMEPASDGTALTAVSVGAPDPGTGITVSSNSVSLQPVATLFGSQQNPLFQPAAFVPSQQ